MNNIVQTSTLVTRPYPDMEQITSPYEQEKPVKELNKYATLKAVGKTFCEPQAIIYIRTSPWCTTDQQYPQKVQFTLSLLSQCETGACLV